MKNLEDIAKTKLKNRPYLKAENQIQKMDDKARLQWLIDFGMAQVIYEDERIIFFEIARLIYGLKNFEQAVSWAECWKARAKEPGQPNILLTFQTLAFHVLEIVLSMSTFPENAAPLFDPSYSFTEPMVVFRTQDGIFRNIPKILLSQTPPEKFDQSFRNHFFWILASILQGRNPLEIIKACPECKRLYAHLTKKEKVFCSPQCTSRALVREKRKADPETYRTKQRELMRKKYERERKEKLGPNVKINRKKEE